MNDLFDDDVRTVSLSCVECGAPVELASSALSLFESEDKVLCLDCLLRVGDTPTPPNYTLDERSALIEDVIEDFSARLRTVLLRSVRADLSWNTEFGFEQWSDPTDSVVAAHAPGIWYAGKKAAEQRHRFGRS